MITNHRKHRIKLFGALILVSTLLFTCCITGNDSPIYVLFTIDTERDLPPYINSYQGMDEGIPLLIDLFEKHNVTATFFTTGNVAQQRPEIIASLAEDHEIGCHGMNHEEPLNTMTYEAKQYSISKSTSILSSIAGYEIISFRAPYQASDTDVCNILEDLGYHVDSSTYYGDDHIYHPSYDDWKKEGDMRILHIPVMGIGEYFYPYNTYPLSWINVFNEVVESQNDNEYTIVVIGLHPWEMCDIEFYPLYCSTVNPCGEYTVNQITSLLEYLDTKNVSYITMEQAYEMLK